MYRQTTWALLLLCFSISSCRTVSTETWDVAARGHYDAGRYSQAYDVVRRAANTGDPVAMKRMGGICAQEFPLGYSSEERAIVNAQRDLCEVWTREELDTQAVKWFLMAANKGDAEAQYLLGMMYYHGDGVGEKDIEEGTVSRNGSSKEDMRRENLNMARRWLEQAALNGVVKAQEQLASIKQDEVAAREAQRINAQQEERARKEAQELTRFCRNRNTPLDAPLPQKLYAGQCYLAENTVAISARLGANGQPQYVYERQLEAMLGRISNSNVQRFALRAAVAAYQSPERANGDLACKWTLRTCLQLVE